VGAAVGELVALGEESSRRYAQETGVGNHPGGIRVKEVEEFAFLRRNAAAVNQSSEQIEHDGRREENREAENERVVFKL
jgi:hypothetical protein